MSVPYRLAIVGGGPTATYAVERLSATVQVCPDRPLVLHVFERNGEFGAGAVHSWTQPATSILNRIAAQVSFAADESQAGAGPLRAREQRPTLHEWCRQRFAATGHPDFDLAPTDWPKRYVHGMALREQFARYAGQLASRPGAEVELHTSEVVDVRDEHPELAVVTAQDGELRVDEVLLATGHPRLHHRLRSGPDELARFADRHGCHYVPFAYPLEETLPESVSGPGTVVGCAGMGLTAIDEILHLTEGRGGRFVRRPGGGLTYQAGGAEPAAVVAFGPTGVFTHARPQNAKEDDLASLEHRGVFLTRSAVARLRVSCGIPAARRDGSVRRQLDFEAHVLPLVLLEMAHLHYTTLFGPAAGRALAERTGDAHRAVLDGAVADPLAVLQAAAGQLAAVVERVVTGAQRLADAERTEPWPVREAVRRWVHVVHGPAGWTSVAHLVDDPQALAARLGALRSPWQLDESPLGNRFDWSETIDPVPVREPADADDHRTRFIEFMARDHLWAAQGNVDNPAKAAADGVWRDLRPVLGDVVDDAGLTAASHRTFVERYMRHHNKLANGAARDVMEKILALVRHGLLDVGVGPGARVELDEDDGVFVVRGPRTGAVRRIDTLVDARVHPFDPAADASPLYRNLIGRGLVTVWRNTSADGSGYEPGGLDVGCGFRAVRADGRVDQRLGVLGPPSEGRMFFQLGALRPDQDHHVMRDVVTWLNGFLDNLARFHDTHRLSAAATPGRPS